MKMCLVCLEMKDKLHDAFTCQRCNDRILVVNFLRNRGTRLTIHRSVQEVIEQ